MAATETHALCVFKLVCESKGEKTGEMRDMVYYNVPDNEDNQGIMDEFFKFAGNLGVAEVNGDRAYCRVINHGSCRLACVQFNDGTPMQLSMPAGF